MYQVFEYQINSIHIHIYYRSPSCPGLNLVKGPWRHLLLNLNLLNKCFISQWKSYILISSSKHIIRFILSSSTLFSSLSLFSIFSIFYYIIKMVPISEMVLYVSLVHQYLQALCLLSCCWRQQNLPVCISCPYCSW